MRFRIGSAVAIVIALVAATTAVAQVDVRNVAVVTGRADVSQVAANKDYLAWAQTSRRRPNQTNLFVKARGGGDRERVNPPGSEGTLGAIDGDRMIYQQFRGSVDDGTSSIKIVNLRSGKRRTPKALNSRHWDFWPAMDGRWVVHGRTNTQKNVTKVLLTNLKSGRTRTLDKARAATYFQPGQVSGSFVTWLRWKPNSKSRLFIYNIATGNKTPVPTGDRFNWAPSLAPNGVVYFGRSGALCGSRVTLHRWSRGDGARRLDRLPNGVDIEDSYTTTNEDGDREVFYSRIVCEPDVSGDVYKLLFMRPDGPVPSPTATTSPSPSPTPEGPTLTVEIEGEGTVTSDPDGIDCDDECDAEFEEGTEITLTADPDEGARIWDWSHPDCGRRDTTCTFEMPEDDLTVTVTFR